MKSILFLITMCLSICCFSQASSLEKDLNTAEQELLQLELEIEQLETQLKQQGQRPKDNFEYLQLKSNSKLQKQKTRQLRKAFKAYQKEQAKLQSQSTTVPNNSAPPVNRKAALKQLKKEIKQLNQQRNAAIKAEISAGRDPMKSSSVLQLDQQILTKTDQYQQLQNNPNTVLPNQPNTAVTQQSQSTTVQNQPANTTPSIPHKQVPTIGLETILFAKFSTEVTADYGQYLNYVAKQLNDDPELRLVIDAFTDNSEKNKVSKELTEKMAHNTAQQFVTRGISPERLIVRAFGDKQAIADNSKFFGQARNRRVELSFTY